MTNASKIVVIGASGFGRECLDVLHAMTSNIRLEVLGVVDDGPSQTNLERLRSRGIVYLGALEEWLGEAPREVRYVIGIGDPGIRRRIAERMKAAGFSAFTAVHPSATVGTKTTLAEGVVVCASAAISTNCQLGEHVHVNPNATIGHDCVIGPFTSINPSAVVSGEVVLGTGVLVGAAAVVLQRLTVGEQTVLGAGTLLTRDAPADVVVKGAPGRW